MVERRPLSRIASHLARSAPIPSAPGAIAARGSRRLPASLPACFVRFRTVLIIAASLFGGPGGGTDRGTASLCAPRADHIGSGAASIAILLSARNQVDP